LLRQVDFSIDKYTVLLFGSPRHAASMNILNDEPPLIN